MAFSNWLVFVAVALLAIASPGPAILLAISNSVRYGMVKVLFSSLGNICGLFIISLTAILGLGAVLKTSQTLFLLVKLVGAAYLIYLGIKQFRSRSNFFAESTIKSTTSRQTRRHSQAFFQGLLIALTNPKAILFFTALFPQFIHTQMPLLPQFLVMTFTFMTLSFIVLGVYGLLANKAKRWFGVGNRTRWFNRLLGSLFVGLGLSMLQLKLER